MQVSSSWQPKARVVEIGANRFFKDELRRAPQLPPAADCETVGRLVKALFAEHGLLGTGQFAHGLFGSDCLLDRNFFFCAGCGGPERQFESKTRSQAHFAGEADVAAVLAQDLAADGSPRPVPGDPLVRRRA